MQEQRIAVIGCGVWGRNIVRNFYNLNVLDTVCDIDEENLKKVKLVPNKEVIVELKNKIDNHAEEGKYKLKVRIKKEGRKTSDDFITEIDVKRRQQIIAEDSNNDVTYESSDVKTKNIIPFIFIISLVLTIVFLVFRKDL